MSWLWVAAAIRNSKRRRKRRRAARAADRGWYYDPAVGWVQAQPQRPPWWAR